MGRVTEPRNKYLREPTLSTWRKAVPTDRVVGSEGPAGVTEQGTCARVAQEPGRAPTSLEQPPRWHSGDPGQAKRYRAPQMGGLLERTNHLVEGTRPKGNRRRPGMGEEQSERSIVPMKPGNRSTGLGGGKGEPETQNRRRDRWPADRS